MRFKAKKYKVSQVGLVGTKDLEHRRLSQVTPIVKLVGIFGPAVADVRTVVHVGDENVLDPRINLSLRLLHRLPGADYREDYARGASDKPLPIHLLYVFDVNLVRSSALKHDGIIFREGFKSGLVVKRKRRHDDAHSNLKTTTCPPLGVSAGRQFPEKIANGRQHAFLLDENCRIPESRRELQRINAIVVHDAVQVDVPDVAFQRQFCLHLHQRPEKDRIGLAPKHRSSHFTCGRTYFSGEQFLVLKIDVDRSYESLPVEKRADRDFHTMNASLQLENFDLRAEGLLIGL